MTIQGDSPNNLKVIIHDDKQLYDTFKCERDYIIIKRYSASQSTDSWITETSLDFNSD